MFQDKLNTIGKPWWASRAILGGLGMVGVVVAGFFGVSIDEQTKALLIDQTEALILAALALISSILAIWGRVSATRTIGTARAVEAEAAAAHQADSTDRAFDTDFKRKL